MFNVFQQPWPLLGLSVIVLFGVFTYRSVFPEKCLRSQWLIPLSVVVLAFGLDFLVKTDREKVGAVIANLIKAAQNENSQAFEALIAPDYADSYHPAKADLAAHARRTFDNIHISKIRKTSCLLVLSPPTAKATLFATVRFEQSSWVTQSYKSFLFFKGELLFEKQPDHTWRITRITPLEVDKQPINWSHIR
ncbi:MAG: hypothetical protein JW720_08320 [Sedimentisphaerales bacterium]|nr:hypothetical protein [Sedimentisphaerales bacterium]